MNRRFAHTCRSFRCRGWPLPPDRAGRLASAKIAIGDTPRTCCCSHDIPIYRWGPRADLLLQHPGVVGARGEPVGRDELGAGEERVRLALVGKALGGEEPEFGDLVREVGLQPAAQHEAHVDLAPLHRLHLPLVVPLVEDDLRDGGGVSALEPGPRSGVNESGFRDFSTCAASVYMLMPCESSICCDD